MLVELSAHTNDPERTIAAAEASFRTSMDWISLLFRKLMFVPTGIPSTT